MTTTARQARSPRLANGTLMARKINNGQEAIKLRREILPLSWAGTSGAGDENRTRTISLGS